jgi:hypothetical protein
MPKTQIADHATIAGVNFSPVGQNIHSVAGLPFRTATVYALLFAVAFGLYSVIWVKAPIMEPDSVSYLRAAQDLSDFHIDQLQERVPGYPILLLLTGSSHSPNRTLFFVSLLLHFASIWLLAIVLYRAGLNEMKLNLFSLILLLPPFVEPAAYVLTETLAEAMLVVAFASLIFWHLNKRSIWILISAASIGYAALTRPTYQLLALAVAAWLVLARFLFPRAATRSRDVVQASLILISGSILIIGGYAFFNYRSFGYFGITAKLGLSLTQKTVHVIERLPDEYAATREVLIRQRNVDLLASGGTSLGYISNVVPELTRITGFDMVRLSNYMLKLNLLLIQKAPLNYLREVVWAFGSYSFPSSTTLANFDSRPVQFVWGALHFFLMAAFACTLIVLVGAAIYISKCKRFVKQRNNIILNSERRLVHAQAFSYGLAGTIVIYTAAISCFIDAGDARHRVPTDVIIVFMVFLGTHLWHRLVDLSRIVLERTQAGTE